MNKQYDIIIIGAGVAGLSLAGLLKDLPLSILIVDKRPVPKKIINVDLMQRAVNATSQEVFEDIGVWSRLTHGAYGTMFVWDGESDIQFKAREAGKDVLGHIVSYCELHLALYEKLNTEKNVTLMFDTNPERFLQLGKKNMLQVSGKQFVANLIVGADGKQSWLRESLGVPCKTKFYMESALVANVKTTLSHQATAWQRFLQTGPLAFLPLADAHRSSIVWTNEASETARLFALDDEAFLGELNKVFENKLGQITEVSKRAAFPLSMQHAAQYVGEGWALLGDAAHVVHPLAGLGLNVGMRDVRCLAGLIKVATSRQQSIGDLALLRRYEREQRSKNKKMLIAVDQIHQLFQTPKPLIARLRRTGLDIADKSSVLKKFFANQVS